MKEIIYTDFYKGDGVSSRDASKFDVVYGVDIHSYPGQFVSSNAMVKETGSTVTELCKCAASIANDETLWFSLHSGKVWKRTSTGGWSLFHTLTSMTGGILGACTYHGNVFFATSGKLGRYNIDTNIWYENIQTFSRAETRYKPMAVQNLTLYIGDQDYIASIKYNTSTSIFDWNANALDIPYEQKTTALAPWKGNLVIGTGSRSSEANSMVLVWDTYSDSWTYEDYVPELYVNTIIPADNKVYMQCGDTGRLYFYDGVELVRDKTLRAESTNPLVNYGGAGADRCGLQYSGQALFYGSSGIWSIDNFSSDFPHAVYRRYIPSAVSTGVVAGCLMVGGSNLLASYESGTNIGVDVISLYLAQGYVITPVAYGNYQNVEVKYASLVAGSSVEIWTKINDGSWLQRTVIMDTINKRAYFDGGLGDVQTLQVKVVLNVSGFYSSAIDYIKIY